MYPRILINFVMVALSCLKTRVQTQAEKMQNVFTVDIAAD